MFKNDIFSTHELEPTMPVSMLWFTCFKATENFECKDRVYAQAGRTLTHCASVQTYFVKIVII